MSFEKYVRDGTTFADIQENPVSITYRGEETIDTGNERSLKSQTEFADFAAKMLKANPGMGAKKIEEQAKLGHVSIPRRQNQERIVRLLKIRRASYTVEVGFFCSSDRVWQFAVDNSTANGTIFDVIGYAIKRVKLEVGCDLSYVDVS